MLSSFIDSVTRINSAINSVVWGIPVLVLIIATGIYFTIRLRFFQLSHFGLVTRSTIGGLFSSHKGSAGKNVLSQFQALSTALAATVGTGNIVGVTTAVVVGGPGAVFWMWISAFFGMSTKACEIIIGQRYREHYKESMNEYVCDRSFVLKNAFGWKKGAVVLAVFCFMFGPWTCCVQTEAVTSSMKEAFGLPSIVTVILIGVTCMVHSWRPVSMRSRIRWSSPFRCFSG